jgi:hypothetical protein
MAWSTATPSSAASIAPSRKASKAYATAIRDQTQPALCECPLWVISGYFQ